MRILVTGACGKLGAATLDTLLRAGHEVTAVDRLPPVYERGGPGRYIQADLTDAGHAAAVPPGPRRDTGGRRRAGTSRPICPMPGMPLPSCPATTPSCTRPGSPAR